MNCKHIWQVISFKGHITLPEKYGEFAGEYARAFVFVEKCTQCEKFGRAAALITPPSIPQSVILTIKALHESIAQKRVHKLELLGIPSELILKDFKQFKEENDLTLVVVNEQ
jgi:hypothetical protein